MEIASPSNGEEERPLCSPTSAITTSPYVHRALKQRYSFLAQKYDENQELEHHAKRISSHNSLFEFAWDTVSAITIYVTHLIRYESIVGCALTVGATLIAYHYYPSDSDEWNGSLPTVLLSFSIITPLGQSISMAFNRREKALAALSAYRSSMYNLYVAHSSWDWGVSAKGKGRRGCVENEADLLAVNGENSATSSPTDGTNNGKLARDIDWLDHSDTLLRHLTQLSDSLYQYLTLPTATRARHRATSKGKKEAADVLSGGRKIFTNNLYGRMVMISQLSEALKYRGLPGNEASRIRQWENNMTQAMEDLRVVKEYRTLQALRVFERLFCLLLPPFYATQYVQIAHDTNSLALGVAMGVITSIALTGLFECVRQLEDPFVSHVTLDGIDVREELVALAHQEMMVARSMLFPEAEEFEMDRECFERENARHGPRKQ